MGRTRRSVLAALSGVLMLGATLAFAQPAAAAGVVNCQAAGTVTYVRALNNGPVSWTVIGRGTCFGDFGGTYFLDLTGTGTSGTFGLCDGSTPGPVQNLNLTISATLTNSATLVPRTLVQKWVAPATTFPVATPFSIESAGSPVGGGTILTRIFGRCPTAGSPVALFNFSFNT